jgi:hypothetical protein
VTHPSTQGRQERRGSHTASALPGRSAAARACSLHRTRAAAAELAAHRRRLLATSTEGGEEDLLSADALLLRVDVAGHHAGLARIADAALLALGVDSHLTHSKDSASDSRPPLSELRRGAEADLRPADAPLDQTASFFTPTVNKLHRSTRPLRPAASPPERVTTAFAAAPSSAPPPTFTRPPRPADLPAAVSASNRAPAPATAATVGATDLRPTDVNSPGAASFAARAGEGSSPSTHNSTSPVGRGDNAIDPRGVNN